MKRNLLLTFSFIALAAISHAQITKGTTFLGGGIGFSSNKRNTPPNFNSSITKEQNLYVSPEVGKAIKENRVAGIFLRYDNRSYTYSGQLEPEKPYYKNYGGGFFLREYFPLNKNFYIYGAPSVAFGYNEDKQYFGTADPTVIKGWSTSLNLATGLTYALSKKFHLEAGLPGLAGISYGQGKSKSNTGETKSRYVSFYSSLSGATDFSIGFRFLLPK